MEIRQLQAPSYPYIETPDGWNAGWKAGLANSESAPAWFTVLGDSFEAGFVTDNVITKRWPRKLKDLLIAGGRSEYAEFYLPSMSLSFMPGSYTGPTLWAFAAGVSWSGNYGITRPPTWTGTPVNPLAFTTPYACTDMDIVYLDGFAGSWTYNVDGVGGTQTVVTTGDGTLRKVQIRGLSNAIHTINFLGQSGNLRLIVHGVTVYKNLNKGVGLGGLSFVGAIAARDYLRQTATITVPTDRIPLFKNLTNVGFPLAGQLLIWALGLNDSVTLVGLNQLREAMRRVFDAYLYSQDGGSILVIAKSHPDPAYTDSTTGFGQYENWAGARRAMREMAKLYNAAWIDFHVKWGNRSVAKLFRTASEPHPIEAGYTDMANTIHAVVTR